MLQLAPRPERRSNGHARVRSKMALMRASRGILALCLTWSTVMAVPPSFGQSETSVRRKQAKRLTRRAFRALAKKDWERGIELLTQAHAKYPKNELLYNIAVAYEKWPGQCKKAVDAYDAFLAACKRCGRHIMARQRRDLVMGGCPGVTVRPDAVHPNGEVALSRTIQTEGWGDITHGRVAEARRAALQDAQRRAVELTSGVHVEALLKDATYEAVRDDRSRFESEVQQKIWSRSEGYLEDFKILEQERRGALYIVRIEARVKNTVLQKELTEIAHRLVKVRFPKVMFVVREFYRDAQGVERETKEPALQAMLEDAFLVRGFDLVAKEEVERMRREQAEAFADLVKDEASVAKYAMRFGAQYVVFGTARVSYQGRKKIFPDALDATTVLSLRSINASTARVVTNLQESRRSPPNCFNEETLRIQSIRHVGRGLVPKFIQRFVAQLTEDVRYVVKVWGGSGSAYLAFQDLLKTLPQVATIGDATFGGEWGAFEVTYPARYENTYLAREILEQAKKVPELKHIDLKKIGGTNIDFVLKSP